MDLHHISWSLFLASWSLCCQLHGLVTALFGPCGVCTLNYLANCCLVTVINYFRMEGEPYCLIKTNIITVKWKRFIRRPRGLCTLLDRLAHQTWRYTNMHPISSFGDAGQLLNLHKMTPKWDQKYLSNTFFTSYNIYWWFFILWLIRLVSLHVTYVWLTLIGVIIDS